MAVVTMACRVARAEEAARASDGEAAAARSRALYAEGGVRVKDRELDRLGRLLEAAKVRCGLTGFGILLRCTGIVLASTRHLMSFQ